MLPEDRRTSVQSRRGHKDDLALLVARSCCIGELLGENEGDMTRQTTGWPLTKQAQRLHTPPLPTAASKRIRKGVGARRG